MSYVRKYLYASHVQKCDFVSNFEILYIYVCFVYMLRAPRQMSYRSLGLPSWNKAIIIIIIINAY